MQKSRSNSEIDTKKVLNVRILSSDNSSIKTNMKRSTSVTSVNKIENKRKKRQYSILESLTSPRNKYSQDDVYTDKINEAAINGNLRELMEARNFGGEWSTKTMALGASKGHYEIIHYLVSKECPYDIETMRAAANIGSIKILELIKNKITPDYTIFEGAIRHGQINVVKWLNEIFPTVCTRDPKLNVAAVKSGSLAMLKLLREMKIPWNYTTMTVACILGKFDIAMWLLSNEVDLPINVADNVAKSGNLEFYQWLYYNKYALGTSYNYAAEYGHINLISWLLTDLKYTIKNEILEYAATGGQFITLTWLVNRGFKCTHKVLDAAVKNGSIYNLEWLIDHIPLLQLYPANININKAKKTQIFNVNHLLEAIKAGNLDLMKFLITKGCPLDEDVTLLASITGKLDILIYAIDQGCPCDYNSCLLAAETNGKTHIYDWITDKLYDADEKTDSDNITDSNSDTD